MFRVIVNGDEISVSADPTETFANLKSRALLETRNTVHPVDDWTLTDIYGITYQDDDRIGKFWPSGAQNAVITLFLALNPGAGG